MTVSDIYTKKRESKLALLKKYSLADKKPVWLISLDASLITDDFLEWLSGLDVNFLIKTDATLESNYKNIVFINKDENKLLGLDFVLCWDCEENMTRYFSSGVAPIASKSNVVSPLLKEFNPGKATGNSYLYEKNNKWDIFHWLIRYLENFKFKYDNNALVKNVLEI